MANWWMKVALASIWMATAASVQAQYQPPAAGSAPAQAPYPPSPGAAAPMPGIYQPPAGAAPAPGLYPSHTGPGLAPEPFPFASMPAGMTPPGGGKFKKKEPPPDQSEPPPPLPANLPNAFTRAPCDEFDNWYVYLGGMGLQRQRLGHGVLALLGPPSPDTGEPPPRNAPVAITFDDLVPGFTFGFRATMGYHWECQALELTGYYLGESNSSRLFLQQGRLDLPFFNTPLGFEGDNGMWLQADRVRLGLNTTLGNLEGNYRWWLGAESTFSWLVGVRWMDVTEHLSIFTDDDASIVDINGQPDPARQADYMVRTHNRIVGPQVGFECNKPLTTFVAFSCSAKAAWGIDFVKEEVLLRRGDGLIGINGGRTYSNFSHLYDLGAYLDWRLTTRSRLRMGYNTLWVVDVSEAVDQVDFDLRREAGTRRDRGSIFYHGPLAELQVIF